MASKLIITKEEVESNNKSLPVKKVEDPKLEGGKKRQKTFPRSSLKTAKVRIKPTSDPAKHPPLKKTMKKHTIRLLTDSGSNHRRKTIKQKIDKMPDEKVKELVIQSKLSKGTAPTHVLREILYGGILSGFVSV
jgi:hypothetical protein